MLRLYSIGQLAVLADLLAGDSSDGSMDGRTIVNSILGAYGLPKLKASPGYRWVPCRPGAAYPACPSDLPCGLTCCSPCSKLQTLLLIAATSMTWICLSHSSIPRPGCAAKTP